MPAQNKFIHTAAQFGNGITAVFNVIKSKTRRDGPVDREAIRKDRKEYFAEQRLNMQKQNKMNKVLLLSSVVITLVLIYILMYLLLTHSHARQERQRTVGIVPPPVN